MIITIDGPVASGKSTLGRMLAKRIGFYHLNTGALYRALAHLLMTRRGYTLKTLSDPVDADVDTYLDPESLIYTYDKQKNEQIFFEGTNITPDLQGSLISQAASIVSTNTAVRKQLLDFQRSFAATHHIVADGRDCGSVVFPSAIIKFFLSAERVARAQRWQKDQVRGGNTLSLDDAINEVIQRDTRDSHRKLAPLIKPGDAVVIDTTDLTLDETLHIMMITLLQNMR